MKIKLIPNTTDWPLLQNLDASVEVEIVFAVNKSARGGQIVRSGGGARYELLNTLLLSVAINSRFSNKIPHEGS